MLARVTPLRFAALLAVLFAVAAGSAAGASSPPKFVGPAIVHPSTAPDFALRDQHRRVVRLAALRGKVVLVTFLYTHCPDLCPFTAINLNNALRQLGPRARNTVVLAVTVDPKGDTPASVASFVRSHRLLPQFHYLTGSRQQLARIWRVYGVSSVRPGGGDPDHTLYTLLVDRSGKGRVLFDALAVPRTVAHDARLLL